MIIKLQRQTFPDFYSQDILIYNEDQSIFTIQHLSKSQMRKIFADERKVYAEAHLDYTIIVIDKVIEDQSW